jgi:aspartyl protease family protein
MGRSIIFAVIAIGALLGYIVPSRPPVPAGPKMEATGQVPLDQKDRPIDTVLKRQSDGHFYAYALVNGQQIYFLVDTGASSIALTEEDARKAGIALNPSAYEVVGEGAGGPVSGQFVTVHHIAIDQKEGWDVDGVVLQGGRMSLLGQAYLEKIGSIQISSDKMILR